jgi:Uma2 family endonuclease
MLGSRSFDEMATEALEEATDERRLTRRPAPIEEFWAMPESVLPTEYVNGEIIMAPTPTVPHQLALSNLFYALRTFVQDKGLGRILPSPLDVVLPTGEVIQPDLFFLDIKQAERMSAAKRVNVVPTFLIEILSPSSVVHDAITKRELYERNGVREYWIVDTEKRSIAQHELRKKHYALTELAEGDTIKGVVLAGFEMNAGELIGL